MNEVISRLRQAKNFREFFTELPYGAVEVIAALPLLLFIISPVWHVVRNLFQFWPYLYTIDSINDISSILCCAAVVLFIGKFAVQRKKGKTLIQENIPLLFFIGFILLMVVSTIVNGFTVYAMAGGSRHESLFSYISYILVFYFLGSLIGRTDLKRLLLWLFLLSGAFLGVLSLVDVYITPLSVFFHLHESKVMAIYMNSNHYGYFLTMILLIAAGCAAFEKKPILRWCAVAIYVINSVVMIINNTFGCYLAVIAGFVFIQCACFCRNRKTDRTIWLLFALFIVISLLMSIKYYTVFSNFLSMFIEISNISATDDTEHVGSGRVMLWRATLASIRERPLLGWGVEGIEERLSFFCGRSHCEYLQYTAFFGIPAGVIYVSGLCSVFWNAIKKRQHLDDMTLTALTAAFSYLVSAVVGNTTYYITPLFFGLLGLAFRIQKEA